MSNINSSNIKADKSRIIMETQLTDIDKMHIQTSMWCAHIPNSKKNINKMRAVFIGNHVKFVPKFDEK